MRGELLTNVINLFGENTSNEENKELTTEDLLEKAKEFSFSKVVLIGVNEDGALSFATNLDSGYEVNYLLDKFKLFMISHF